MQNTKQVPVRGINYSVGIRYVSGGHEPIRPNLQEMRTDLKAIQQELHCNAIRIYGDELDRIVECTQIAFNLGLEVWASPRKIDLEMSDTVEYIRSCAQELQQVNSPDRKLTLVVGCEFTIDLRGLVPGRSIYDRLRTIFNPLSFVKNAFGVRPGYNEKLGRLLTDTVRSAREVFSGAITYAAGMWEEISPSLFDVLSVNYYRDHRNERSYVSSVQKLTSGPKPVAITEFGCGAFQGAERLGAGSYRIVSRKGDRAVIPNQYKRDEGVQARYLHDLLAVFAQQGVYAAFPFEFIDRNSLHSEDPARDLDMASFGVVKMVEDSKAGSRSTWVPKKAFHTLASMYDL